jgi:putative flippase GtrA
VRSVPLQFLLYLTCSAVAAAVNLLVGFVLISSFGFTSSLQYPVAVAAGYCAGMAVNFLLNRRLTFQGSDRTKIQQGRTFLIVALSGLVLTSALAALVRAALSVVVPTGALGGHMARLVSPETIGQIVAIGVVSVYSYAGHRYLTFNRGIRFQLLKILKLGPVKNADE